MSTRLTPKPRLGYELSLPELEIVLSDREVDVSTSMEEKLFVARKSGSGLAGILGKSSL